MNVFFIIMFYCVYGQMSEIKNYYYYDYKVQIIITTINVKCYYTNILIKELYK